MERIYRVVAIRRDGVWQYWEPTLGLFTFKEIPTNRYYKYTEALGEYRRAIDKSNPDDMSCVSIHEKMGTDGTWHTLKERQFTQNERSITSIDKKVFSCSLDLLSISMQVYPNDAAYLPQLRHKRMAQRAIYQTNKRI